MSGTVVDDDCPLCLEPMSDSDRRYPLHCQTPTCHFQFCGNCLQKLAHSARDGYTQASDGSNQVKVGLMCPICRAPYGCSEKTSSKNSAIDDDNDSDAMQYEGITATQIVDSVIQLRQAASTPLPHTKDDSQLSARELSLRNVFLREVSIKELQDAVRTIQKYNSCLVEKEIAPVPELDWDEWRPHLQQRQCSPDVAVGSTVLLRDPTLFVGLEALLNKDEQEFITSMLVSGKEQSVAEAANLLHGILEMAAERRTAARDPHSSSQGRRIPPPTPSPTHAQIEHQANVRKRFPLPAFMPRTVSLPVYDVTERTPTLEFKPDDGSSSNNDGKKMSQLKLARVRGPAGRVGLRKGDTVTHVGSTRVQTLGDFVVAMQFQGIESMFQMSVNADKETAQALRERSENMKKQGIKFNF